MDFCDILQKKNLRVRNTNALECLDSQVKVQKIPTFLSVEYSTDYDIVRVDEIIKQKLSAAPVKEKELLKKLARSQELLEEACRVVTINRLKQEIAELKKELNDVTQVYTLANYSSETFYLIQEYITMPENEQTNNLMSVTPLKISASELKKSKLVDNYLAIAKKYMPMKIEKTKPQSESAHKQICLSCFESILSLVYDSKGNRICQCGAENRADRIEQSSGKDYDVLTNLIKSVRRDTCTQLFNFDVEILLEKLDTYFESMGKHTREYYKNIPVNEFGRKKGTSQDDIIAAMRELKYNDYYRDYLYICHRFYGWERLDVSNYESLIKDHFRATQYVWDNLMTEAEKERSSSLPVEYRKFKHYQLINENEKTNDETCLEYRIPCDVSHFKFAKKPETVKMYDRIWKIMCDRAGRQDIYFIPT